jgi:hypothetical protein
MAYASIILFALCLFSSCVCVMGDDCHLPQCSQDRMDREISQDWCEQAFSGKLELGANQTMDAAKRVCAMTAPCQIHRLYGVCIPCSSLSLNSSMEDVDKCIKVITSTPSVNAQLELDTCYAQARQVCTTFASWRDHEMLVETHKSAMLAKRAIEDKETGLVAISGKAGAVQARLDDKKTGLGAVWSTLDRIVAGLDDLRAVGSFIAGMLVFSFLCAKRTNAVALTCIVSLALAIWCRLCLPDGWGTYLGMAAPPAVSLSNGVLNLAGQFLLRCLPSVVARWFVPAPAKGDLQQFVANLEAALLDDKLRPRIEAVIDAAAYQLRKKDETVFGNTRVNFDRLTSVIDDFMHAHPTDRWQLYLDGKQ